MVALLATWVFMARAAAEDIKTELELITKDAELTSLQDNISTLAKKMEDYDDSNKTER